MIVVLIIVGFVGYSYYEIENSNGIVNISITSSGYNAQFNLTFTSIDLRSSNYSLWTNYSTGGTTIDLADYEVPGNFQFGSVSLIEGNYTMIRLNLTNAELSENGVAHKLNLLHSYAYVTGDFVIPAKVTTYFTLEFQLSGNINMTTHTFNPVIQVLN